MIIICQVASLVPFCNCIIGVNREKSHQLLPCYPPITHLLCPHTRQNFGFSYMYMGINLKFNARENATFHCLKVSKHGKAGVFRLIIYLFM